MDDADATAAAETSTTTGAGASGMPGAAAIEVVGDASAEQVAALVAVLSGLSGQGEAAPGPTRSAWSDPGTAQQFYLRRRTPAWRAWHSR